MAEVTAVRARISETTPRDLRGVDLLAPLAARRLDRPVAALEGRRRPFARTPWDDDLAASRAVLGAAGRRLEAALVAGEPAVTVASDCALALGTLPALARARVDARVLWLDAHCDFDTPATTIDGFLGCMSLAGAVGAWDAGLGPPVAPGRVVLLGARAGEGDFDAAAQRAVEASAVTVVAASEPDAALEALGAAPVYVHLDPDVLDPADNPIPYGRPGGLAASALTDLLAALASRGPVLGVEVTAFHSQDDPVERARVADLLLAAVEPLVAGPVAEPAR